MDVRFYVNSRPQYSSDIILNNRERIKSIVENNIMNAPDEYEVGKHCIYSKQKGLMEQDIKPDALLTPLLYSYNSALNRSVQTCIGDMPMLVQRERFAKSLKLSQLKDILDETVGQLESGNFGFNPIVKHHDVFIKPRAAYIAEVLRQCAMISQKDGTVAVFDHDLVHYIETAWTNLPRDL